MNQFEEIIPVSLFKKCAKEYLARLETNGNPILMTVHGHGAFVLMHVNSFMRISELSEIGRHQLAFDSAYDRTQQIHE